jgi:hypothetical protein
VSTIVGGRGGGCHGARRAGYRANRVHAVVSAAVRGCVSSPERWMALASSGGGGPTRQKGLRAWVGAPHMTTLEVCM